MALSIFDLMTTDVDGQSVLLPKTITFAASVNDPDAPAGVTKSHTVRISLDPDNSLVFSIGTKSVGQNLLVGRARVPVTFTETVSGPTAGLVAFKVTLRDDFDQELHHRFVQLSRVSGGVIV